MPALQLSPELERRLDASAGRTGRSRESLTEEAVAAFLDGLERDRVAQARPAEPKADGTVQLEELMRRHYLES